MKLRLPTLLRAVAVVAVIQYVGHSVLFFTSKPKHGQAEELLLVALKSQKWDFAGFNRSYWDFYFGYGLIAILWGVVQISLLWLLSNIAKTNPNLTKPIIWLLIGANIAHVTIVFNYFFLLPVIFDTIIVLLLLTSLTTFIKNSEA